MVAITTADLLPAARALGPSLAERSERIEATRTLPDDVVADLRNADLTLLPKLQRKDLCNWLWSLKTP